MIFLRYLFVKDLNRLKIIFCAWILLIFAQLAMGIGGSRLAAEFLQFQMFMPLFSKVIGLLQALMMIVIVPLIIQEDSLVGTTAFWLTRPISKKGLLLTKAYMIFIVLICAPLIAELFVLFANGASARLVLLALPEIFIEKWAFIILFVILAVITPRFSRYALIGIIIFAGFVILGIIWAIASMFIPKYFPQITKFIYTYKLYKNPSLFASVTVVDNIFTILTGSILVSYQFLKRNTAKTVIWVIIAFLISFGIPRIWKWDFLKEVSAAQVASTKVGALSVIFDLNDITVADEPRYGKEDIRSKSVSAREYVKGLPFENFVVLNSLDDVNLSFPDGNTVKSGYVSCRNVENYTESKLMLPMQAALKDTKLLNPYKGEPAIEVFNVNDVDYLKYKDTKGTYSGKAEFDVYKYEIVLRMPLREGAKDSFGSEQAVVYDILEKQDEVSIIINEKKINLLFDRTVKKDSRVDPVMEMCSKYERVYLLVNEKRHEAFLPEEGGNLYDDMTAAYGKPRLENMAKKYDFTSLNNRSGPLPKIDKQWLAEAELVRLDAVKTDTKKFDFTIANFEIPAQSQVTNKENAEFQKQLKLQDRAIKKQGNQYQ
jgi:hypothetical protein